MGWLPGFILLLVAVAFGGFNILRGIYVHGGDRLRDAMTITTTVTFALELLSLIVSMLAAALRQSKEPAEPAG